jgi:DNA-binding transcriptional LysR family regulator
MNLELLQIFSRIAQLRSLSAVARERNVPVSQISRALSRLEAHYGVRLIHRTTHGLSLTPEGETFCSYCKRVGSTLDELDAEFSAQTSGAKGTVRMGVSAVMALSLITPGLPKLRERHPELDIDLHVNDAIVDMSREGIDMTIRTGEPQSDNLVARPIGRHTRRIYATPDYLAKHGAPKHPDDLSNHLLIGSSLSPQLNEWSFQLQGQTVVRTMQGQYQANSTGVMFGMMLTGLGIGRSMDLIAQPFVQRGELVPLLEDFLSPQIVPIYAVMLSERHRLPKVRACFDFWSEWFRGFMPPDKS